MAARKPSQFDLIKLRQQFETAHTTADYDAAIKQVRKVTNDQAFELVDSMIDAKLRIAATRGF